MYVGEGDAVLLILHVLVLKYKCTCSIIKPIHLEGVYPVSPHLINFESLGCVHVEKGVVHAVG